MLDEPCTSRSKSGSPAHASERNVAAHISRQLERGVIQLLDTLPAMLLHCAAVARAPIITSADTMGRRAHVNRRTNGRLGRWTYERES